MTPAVLVPAPRFLLLLAAALALLPALPACAEISGPPSGPTVTVQSPRELERAYLDLSAWADGGGTIYLASDYPPAAEINLSGGGSNPVHITSADPSDAVQVSRIAFDEVDNVRVSNVHVDSTGVVRQDFFRDLDITNSSRIEIADSVFTSNGTATFGPNAPGGVLGERLSMVRYSDDITILDSFFSGHSQGLTFHESTNITVTGNEITAQQGDGIRLQGVQDVLIANNYLHDFAATPNEFTHSDFIQMWSTNAEIVSANVTVTGNVLDTGNGVSVQAIWMRNEAHDAGDTSYVYQNITVTDNVIYTGSANGIGIGQADGVLVANNTLLWNEGAFTVKATGDTSYQPRIRLHEDITNLQVIDNITPRILSGPDANLQGNVIVSYDPSSPDYVGNHFVDAAQGGDIGPEGWQLRPNSPWVGTGATASQPGADDPT
jgi:hypothetical protein